MAEANYINSVKAVLDSLGMNGEMIAEKLKKYEELKVLQEQGRLIIPPCVVGDEVYRITVGRDIESHYVERLIILPDGLYITVFHKVNKIGCVSTYPAEELYFTWETAEKALKGVEDE